MDVEVSGAAGRCDPLESRVLSSIRLPAGWCSHDAWANGLPVISPASGERIVTEHVNILIADDAEVLPDASFN
jgi:hypothetical protein